MYRLNYALFRYEDRVWLVSSESMYIMAADLSTYFIELDQHTFISKETYQFLVGFLGGSDAFVYSHTRATDFGYLA